LPTASPSPASAFAPHAGKARAFEAAARVHAEVEQQFAHARRNTGVTLDLTPVDDWEWPDWRVLADWFKAVLIEDDWQARSRQLPGAAFDTGVVRNLFWRDPSRSAGDPSRDDDHAKGPDRALLHVGGENFSWGLRGKDFAGVDAGLVDRRGGHASSRLRLSEPIALPVHLEDVDMMGEVIEQRAGQTLIAEYARPLVEGQIGGDDGRGARRWLNASNSSSAPV
jgi:hypothetical protein